MTCSHALIKLYRQFGFDFSALLIGLVKLNKFIYIICALCEYFEDVNYIYNLSSKKADQSQLQTTRNQRQRAAIQINFSYHHLIHIITLNKNWLI